MPLLPLPGTSSRPCGIAFFIEAAIFGNLCKDFYHFIIANGPFFHFRLFVGLWEPGQEKKAIKLMQYGCHKVVDISRAEQFTARKENVVWSCIKHSLSPRFIMLLVALYVIQLALGANKARSSRTWSSPGHLSLIALWCYAAGRPASRQARGEELSRVSQATSHYRWGLNIYVTADLCWKNRTMDLP